MSVGNVIWKNILWVDRGSKYIWLAYIVEDQKIPLPIWYILNNSSTLFGLADIIARKRIKTIVLWYPGKQKNIQIKIDKFIKELKFIVDPEIQFQKVNEDYSTVQSWEITSNFKKTVAVDTVSAMVILGNWLSQKEIQ